MGQYYKFVILDDKKKGASNKTKVNTWLSPYDYENGAKLMEFSWLRNTYCGVFENLICKETGVMAGHPVVCAGDYADHEPRTYNGEKVTLYDLCYFQKEKKVEGIIPLHYRYIINEDKKLFIDTKKCVGDEDGYKVHPLPLMICEGNGRGGGDYHGADKNKVGEWARNVVVVSDTKPDESEYKEYIVNFKE